MSKQIDMTGRKIGKLTVLYKSHSDEKGRAYWMCQCDCGSEPKVIWGTQLRRGKTNSCGCLHDEFMIKHNCRQKKLNEYEICEDFVKIFCTNNRYFTINLSDLECVLGINRKWNMHISRNYPQTNLNKKRIKLHNYLMNPKDGYIIDHIDGDVTNNKRENLRECMQIENVRNSSTKRNNTSGRKGVYFNKRYNNWYAKITYNHKSIFLGTHQTFEEACIARENAEKQYFGEFANNR